MFVFQFTPLTISSFIIPVISVISIYSFLFIAWQLDVRNHPNWQSRKTIHIGVGTVIGLTLTVYESLTEPALTLVLFFIPLLIGQLFGGYGKELISLARRKEGNKMSALAAGVSALVAYGIIFIFLPERPDIFVAAILAVSWGDGAGEMIGRPFGTHGYTISGNERTLEGSGAVAFFSLLAFSISVLLFTTFDFLQVFPFLLAIAITVALIEAVSPLWTDNFLIPICTAVLFLLLIY